mmetsp:Transcript_18319/g.29252  ORF Transcript_18319/g.29252 Transcript_18319/m.29252 type:complete len:101 (+) Transcript_18319:472-774(+)
MPCSVSPQLPALIVGARTREEGVSMTPLPSQILDSGVVEHGEHLQGKDIPHVLLPGSLQSNVALVPPWQRVFSSCWRQHGQRLSLDPDRPHRSYWMSTQK